MQLHNFKQIAERSVKRYSTPLRYPGGKASFASFIAGILRRNSLCNCNYYEPFAGGAGAALKLLTTRVVAKIHLNDADFRIYALWHSIFNHNQRFCNAVRNATLTISEWHKQFSICDKPKGYTKFEIAYATFFMNRCNRSGVILGARPIGGLKQNGTFLIDARFNREVLAQRIEALASLKDHVSLYNLDAMKFLKLYLPKGLARKNVFVYLDPPYYRQGQRLYLNYYAEADHKELSVYMKRQNALNWLMSYDSEKEISDLYGSLVRRQIDVSYSMQLPYRNKELLIAPTKLKLK